jgi:hypothetical protein
MAAAANHFTSHVRLAREIHPMLERSVLMVRGDVRAPVPGARATPPREN